MSFTPFCTRRRHDTYSRLHQGCRYQVLYTPNRSFLNSTAIRADQKWHELFSSRLGFTSNQSTNVNCKLQFRFPKIIEEYFLNTFTAYNTPFLCHFIRSVFRVFSVYNCGLHAMPLSSDKDKSASFAWDARMKITSASNEHTDHEPIRFVHARRRRHRAVPRCHATPSPAAALSVSFLPMPFSYEEYSSKDEPSAPIAMASTEQSNFRQDIALAVVHRRLTACLLNIPFCWLPPGYPVLWYAA